MALLVRRLLLFVTLLALCAGTAPGATAAGDGAGRDTTGPLVRIVSPAADAQVAPGVGQPGAGSSDGSGFALNVEVVTRDDVPIRVNEGLNIRHVDLLGRPNPDFPALGVSFDIDLITPGGGIIPRHTNLGALFNVAGTDDTPGPGVTIWAGWHVLESLPAGIDKFTITATVRDEAGRVGLDRLKVRVDRRGGASGQALTPDPAAAPAGADAGIADARGPLVTMIAPRAPSSVATGPDAPAPPASGALFFIQVAALDRAGAGISSREGVILDGAQIAAGGPNRNFPGLTLTFDVPLRQPNGNVVSAGANLAPLFNVSGSERGRGGAVRVTADWVVGGTLLLPEGRETVTVTARVTDNAGRTGVTSRTFGVSPVINGQDLTPQP